MDATVPSLETILAQVPDPRRARRRRHPWTAVLLMVGALLNGATTQRACARWGREAGWRSLRWLGFTRPGGPSRATLNRLLRGVEVAALEAALGDWLQQVRAAWWCGAAHWLDGIAVDGRPCAARGGWGRRTPTW
jgi:DDE_Tnp_1-associated